MTDYGKLFRNLFEEQLRRDFGISHKLSLAQRKVRRETEALVEAMSNNSVDEMELSAFQERLSSNLQDLVGRSEAFVEAAGVDEATTKAASDLVAAFGSRLLALETRVAAIEIGLSQSP